MGRNGAKLAYLWISSNQHPMGIWTSERCKTLDTLVLMENLREMSMQAALTKNASRKARLFETLKTIHAELRLRGAALAKTV